MRTLGLIFLHQIFRVFLLEQKADFLKVWSWSVHPAALGSKMKKKKRFLASFFTFVGYGCALKTYTKRRFVENLITKILFFFCPNRTYIFRVIHNFRLKNTVKKIKLLITILAQGLWSTKIFWVLLRTSPTGSNHKIADGKSSFILIFVLFWLRYYIYT